MLTSSSKLHICSRVSTHTIPTWVQWEELKVKSIFRFFRYILGSTYLCWAYSCASMLRASCSILIKTLRAEEKIDEKREADCLKFIMKPENHRTIRNLVAMILLPKQLHKNDKSNAAYLRAAVSRVSCTVDFVNYNLDCKSNGSWKTWRFYVGTNLSAVIRSLYSVLNKLTRADWGPSSSHLQNVQDRRSSCFESCSWSKTRTRWNSQFSPRIVNFF